MKMLFAFLIMLTGIGICIWTDVYLRANAAEGVNLKAWDTVGSLLLGAGAVLLIYLIAFKEE